MQRATTSHRLCVAPVASGRSPFVAGELCTRAVQTSGAKIQLDGRTNKLVCGQRRPHTSSRATETRALHIAHREHLELERLQNAATLRDRKSEHARTIWAEVWLYSAGATWAKLEQCRKAETCSLGGHNEAIISSGEAAGKGALNLPSSVSFTHTLAEWQLLPLLLLSRKPSNRTIFVLLDGLAGRVLRPDWSPWPNCAPKCLDGQFVAG